MKNKHIPLIVGNWKMNPKTLEKAESLVSSIKKGSKSKHVVASVCVAAPLLFTSAVGRSIKGSRILLGAQDVSAYAQGAHTGEVSVGMLKDQGVSSVIVGHSERRALGETDVQVGEKAAQVLKAGLTAIVCVGEKTRDTQGDYFGVVEAQLQAVFAHIIPASLKRLVIAYEPVWAIGTSVHATAEDVQEMKLFIQKILSDTFGRNAVLKVRILYGGSVTADNAEDLLITGHADGFLIGGASLDANEFCTIIRIADIHGKA